MMPIDNHWNYGKEYRDQMTAPEPSRDDILYDIEKHWQDYSWERGDLIDFDTEERQYNYIMTMEFNGQRYEGTGVYVCDELIIVENIEIVN